jgi:lysophospholipase L1-like esterase
MTTFAIWLLLVAVALGQPSVRVPTIAPVEVHAAALSDTLAGKVYVALGDSISAGKYATTQDGIFPTIVADRLQMNLDLVARSGAKADWALPRLVSIASAHPALVTIELGTNDAGFHTPAATFRSQYDVIVNAVSSRGTRVLCIGSWLPAPDYDAIIMQTCTAHGGTFVSLDGFYGVNAFHAPNGASSYLGRTDWFHPGDAGHEAIAAAVLATLGAGPPPVLPTTGSAPRIADVIRTHPQ